MPAKIAAISYYLPDKVVTNEDLAAQFPDWSVEKISSKVGISQRHIAPDGVTASDMACMAAEKLFAEHGIDRAGIDFLILCTQSPDYALPPSACILQSRLGLSTGCGAFDIDLGCSGYIYLLALAKGLISAGIAKRVLLLTAETYSKHMHPADKGNMTIFGDAATATLVCGEGFAQIGEFALGTDGSGYDKLIVRNGGARAPKGAPGADGEERPDYLYMDGKAIFDFSSEVVPSMAEQALRKNGLELGDVDLSIFHQANKYMINYLRKLMEIDKEKFYICLENVGNTVSSTIPIALCEARKEGRVRGNVLLAGFGVGLSWGAVVIKA